jgi:hypothetical protein
MNGINLKRIGFFHKEKEFFRSQEDRFPTLRVRIYKTAFEKGTEELEFQARFRFQLQ